MKKSWRWMVLALVLLTGTAVLSLSTTSAAPVPITGQECWHARVTSVAPGGYNVYYAKYVGTNSSGCSAGINELWNKAIMQGNTPISSSCTKSPWCKK